MDNNERAIQEAVESLDQVLHHIHFVILGLLRLQLYLNKAQAKGNAKGDEQVKGQEKGKSKGHGKDGKGQDKGKGYGKTGRGHNFLC